MRILIVSSLALLFAGCSGQPMTPEQQAVMMQIIKNNQASAAQQQQIGIATMNAQSRAVQPANMPVNCTTTYVGNQAYTQCQ